LSARISRFTKWLLAIRLLSSSKKGISSHQLHRTRYLQEFAFRYSHRAALGVDDAERTGRVIQGAEGKRLTYRPTRSQAEESRGT
jgi:hypothetical protein